MCVYKIVKLQTQVLLVTGINWSKGRACCKYLYT